MKPPREERDVRERRDRSHKAASPVDFFAFLAPCAFPARLAFRASLAFLASLALTLPGCKMGPDYTRPETPSADVWRMTTTTSESIANLPWWELLKDQELQRLIRTALEENQDVRTAAASVEEFQAQLVISRFDLAPSVGYGGQAFVFNAARNSVGIPMPGGGGVFLPSQNGTTLSNESAYGGLKWEMDLWGKIRRSIEVTRAQLLARQEAQRAVILGLIGTVAEAYFDLRQLDLQLDITRQTLKAWDETVRISRIKLDQGAISKLDLDRFEAELAHAAALLADLERQSVQKENQISLLLGRKPAQISRGNALTAQTMAPDIPAGLPSDLLRRRPDILQAEQDLVAATAGIGVAQASRFPQVSLTGALGVANPQLSSISPGIAFTQYAAAAVTGPLLNATALGYQVKVAEARTKQASLQYEKTIVTAFREVEDALIAAQKSREQGKSQEAQVASLRSALDLADLRYRGGRASYLDVLTAQRSLFDAQLALARTHRTQLVSVVQLYKALGGGWSPDDMQRYLQASVEATKKPAGQSAGEP
ncbi:MAG: efflux transporter outer membrane subunit [Nitrospira sp.]|nr:efflux transporter outer membrane subunit [Nitrospira sp.]